MLLLMRMSLVTTPGGEAILGSASQRTPRFTVRFDVARQLSPSQIAYVGRGISIVQSSSLRAKFTWKSRATAFSGARFHFEGSNAASCGTTAPKFAGAALNVKKPCRWMYHGPPL